MADDLTKLDDDKKNIIVKNAHLTLEVGEIAKYYFSGTYIRLESSSGGSIRLVQDNSNIVLFPGDFLRMPYSELEIENLANAVNVVKLVVSNAADFGSGSLRIAKIQGIVDANVISNVPTEIYTDPLVPIQVQVEQGATQEYQTSFSTKNLSNQIQQQIFAPNNNRVYFKVSIINDRLDSKEVALQRWVGGDEFKIQGGLDAGYETAYEDKISANLSLEALSLTANPTILQVIQTYKV